MSLAADQKTLGVIKKPTEADLQTEVVLFTDGACLGNPGPGGWGYILRHRKTGAEVECSGGEPETTNNRMEMLAVIEGLLAMKRQTSVEIVSDSEYVLRGLRDWMPGWKKKGWKRSGSTAVKNIDLWQELDRLTSIHRVVVTHVRGHRGHPENERCDQIAVEAAKNAANNAR